MQELQVHVGFPPRFQIRLGRSQDLGDTRNTKHVCEGDPGQGVMSALDTGLWASNDKVLGEELPKVSGVHVTPHTLDAGHRSTGSRAQIYWIQGTLWYILPLTLSHLTTTHIRKASLALCPCALEMWNFSSFYFTGLTGKSFPCVSWGSWIFEQRWNCSDCGGSWRWIQSSFYYGMAKGRLVLLEYEMASHRLVYSVLSFYLWYWIWRLWTA